MVLYPTEHRNDNNIQSMYHSSATSRTTSSRLRNRVVIIARRADRAAVICCCWVARRAVTCMRPLSSQHSSVGSPSQSCMMQCMIPSSAHRMSRQPQGVRVSRRTGSGSERLPDRQCQAVGAYPIMVLTAHPPRAICRQKSPLPSCVMHAQSPGLDETSTVILYHVVCNPPAS